MRETAFVICVAVSLTVSGTACSRSDRSADAAPRAVPAAVAQGEVDASRGVVKRSAEAVRIAGDTHGYAPDNTGVNVRDRGGDTLTATDQSESATDRTVTQQIRRAIVADDSLSTAAHNVKIITVDGVVTIRGPVKNDQERSAIVAKANQVAGVKRLDDQLEIAPGN